MPTTSYYSIGGELIGEKVGTNARTDYLTDALGNVTATLNQSGRVLTRIYSYWLTFVRAHWRTLQRVTS